MGRKRPRRGSDLRAAFQFRPLDRDPAGPRAAQRPGSEPPRRGPSHPGRHQEQRLRHGPAPHGPDPRIRGRRDRHGGGKAERGTALE